MIVISFDFRSLSLRCDLVDQLIRGSRILNYLLYGINVFTQARLIVH